MSVTGDVFGCRSVFMPPKPEFYKSYNL